MFWTRLISGAVMLAILTAANHFGGNVLWLLMATISIIGLFEFYRAVGLRKTGLEIAGYVMSVIWWIFVNENMPFEDGFLMAIIVLTMIVMGAVFVLKFPKYDAKQLFAAVFGFLYVIVSLAFVYSSRVYHSGGRWIVWLIFAAAWGSDTGAYCIGKLFGKHKLVPVLSPHKSVEGAFGGVAGGALFGAVLGVVMHYIQLEEWVFVGVFACIGAVGGVVSQFGDLIASGIKRNYDIKDYGHLIPGHGGIMDRFDSVIITAPIVFYLASMLIE